MQSNTETDKIWHFFSRENASRRSGRYQYKGAINIFHYKIYLATQTHNMIPQDTDFLSVTDLNTRDLSE